MGTLYIVATPIGNLEDITLRALRVLGEVSLIAAEDTRKARVLLERYKIRTPVTSFFEGNERRKMERILDALGEGDVALISEAGMPGISDPGYPLIRAALEEGIPVVPLPGPSAHTAALVVSGLPTDRFLFAGFLPRKESEQRAILEEVADVRATLAARSRSLASPSRNSESETPNRWCSRTAASRSGSMASSSVTKRYPCWWRCRS